MSPDLADGFQFGVLFGCALGVAVCAVWSALTDFVFELVDARGGYGLD